MIILIKKKVFFLEWLNKTATLGDQKMPRYTGLFNQKGSAWL